jgi:hypothetical protein
MAADDLGALEGLIKFVNTVGAPAATGVLGYFLAWQERRDSRKENRILQHKLLELAMAQITATTKNEAALAALKAELAKPR